MLNSRVKHIQHVVLSADRPAQTDPIKVFANFQGNVIGKKYARKQANDSTPLLYRREAISLLGQYAREKEREQKSRSSRASAYYECGLINHMPNYRTETVEDRTPMIGSKDEVYSQADVGFFESVLLAYTNHWNLRTSPDDWWFCVIKTISHHIDLYCDIPNVRKMFVNFEGKQDLMVEVTKAQGWPVFEDMDFSSFFNNIGLEIAKNVKVPEYVDGVTADFTTTTAIQKIVSQITLMSSVQAYFNFTLCGGCGIPAIEMKGTEDDWKKLLSKLKVLKTLLEPITDDIKLKEEWWSLVTKIFENLLETYRGQPDEDWWSRIMTYERPYGSGSYLSSGPPRYSGWIVEFLKGAVGDDIGILLGDFPSAIVTVPLGILDLETRVQDMSALVAGMVGVTVHESVGNDRVTVEPFQGWSLLLPKDSPFRGEKYTKKKSTDGHSSKSSKKAKTK
jgi:hypothetical protein